jgi:hypothetical protein
MKLHRHASLGATPLAFTVGHSAARAELNNVRWVSHCRGSGPVREVARQRFETDRPETRIIGGIIIWTRLTA